MILASRMSMRFLLLFASSLISAQTITLSGPATATSGKPFAVSVSDGTGWAAESWQLNWTGPLDPSGLSPTSVASTVAGKFTQSTVNAGSISTVSAGANCQTSPCQSISNTTITTAGQIATVNLAALPGATGPITLSLTKVVAADATGSAVTVTAGSPITINVVPPNFCDLDGNGVVDGADLYLQFTWSTQGAPAGRTAARIPTSAGPAQDIEIVLIAALGGACRATQ